MLVGSGLGYSKYFSYMKAAASMRSPLYYHIITKVRFWRISLEEYLYVMERGCQSEEKTEQAQWKYHKSNHYDSCTLFTEKAALCCSSQIKCGIRSGLTWVFSLKCVNIS